MAIELVNLGNSANDGTGDDLRIAFEKVNNSLTFVESIAQQEGVNLGTAGAEVYKNTVDNNLFFRRLVAGDNIAINELENTIVIENTQPASSFVISGNSGSLIAGSGVNYAIIGEDAITVHVDNNTGTISIRGSLLDDPNPTLSENLNANSNTIGNVGVLETERLETQFIGSAPYDQRLGRYIEGFDGGDILPVVNSTLDFIVATYPVDFGTIQLPASINVDLGVGF